MAGCPHGKQAPSPAFLFPRGPVYFSPLFIFVITVLLKSKHIVPILQMGPEGSEGELSCPRASSWYESQVSPDSCSGTPPALGGESQLGDTTLCPSMSLKVTVTSWGKSSMLPPEGFAKPGQGVEFLARWRLGHLQTEFLKFQR